MSGKILLCCLVLCFCLTTGVSAQEPEDEAAEANNPLAALTSLNFHNQYFNEISGTDTDANQIYLRFAKPFAIGDGKWVFRATLPVSTLPVGADFAHKTGIGDLNMFAAYLIDMGNPAISFGIGPQLTIPTASKDETGSKKWSAGFANVMFNGTNAKFQWGYLLTWQASFAGDDDRKDVNFGAFQPFLFYQLGDGWYIRSTGIWSYDFETDNYAIPIGLGLGRVIATDRAVVNIFAEPQYTVAHEGDGQPINWSLYTGINFQF